MSKVDSSILDSFPDSANTKADYVAPSRSMETQLAQLDANTDFHLQLEDTVLNLSDYLKTVEVVVKETFAHQVWVKAEIRNLSTKNGHYYFELAEKNDQGKIIASCRGNLWKYQAGRILKKFAQYTGMQLSKDLTVMLKVTANLHPQYGFSLTISDIDPNYTVGDLARQYTAMLNRLSGEGLTQLNKTHQLPLDLQHIIVIAPEKAAGLGDFRAEADHLQQYNVCQFHYHHATFQGNHAPKEIRQSIANSVKRFENNYHQLPDLMVIIRGGGAVGDLGYLNDYELAALIAEQPMPVWVGIGHERDRVILDEVAHTSFDTPSKVINAIINHLRALVENTQNFINHIEKYSKQQLHLAKSESQSLIHQIQAKSISQLINLKKDCDHSMASIEMRANQKLRRADETSWQYIENIKRQSQQAIHLAQSNLNQYNLIIKNQTQNQLKQTRQNSDHYLDQLKTHAYQIVNQADSETKHLREVVLLQHPKQVLKKGYAIVRDANSQKTLTSIKKTYTSQTLYIQLQDGQLQAQVCNTENDKQN